MTSGDVCSIVDRLVGGDRRALAKAITAVENGGGADLIRQLFPLAGGPPVVGITGPSGAGKSTLVNGLTTAYRAEGKSVGVLAIDPTSPFTGGALLGDRVRMREHFEDEGVYVRSMATRGAMGGLSAAVYDTLAVLSAAGFDRLLVETVGVGQDEVDVAGVADTTCVVLTPVGGDEIQAIKAGIMEVADIFVLNKSDMPGTDRAEAQLHAWVTQADDGEWDPRVVRTVGSQGDGIDELKVAIRDHEDWYRASGKAGQRRRALARFRLHTLLRQRLLGAVRSRGLDEKREDELVAAIASGDLDPYSAAESIVAEVFGE
ncbi:MAG: methylmalonyl Co-A mutase-associated GTPase MeaB [Acidobacteriota bacterium]|nr:methylmalonyl Co-A mutase-associated GTPase MeaB [Acidobacteriota bacterium]MEE3274571.1 methylmalonyl Co-A mutase-associated GTPase MeaB [Acidobacteriota bacterium]